MGGGGGGGDDIASTHKFAHMLLLLSHTYTSHTHTHTHTLTHPFITHHTHTGIDVVCTWSGQLPPRRHKNPTYSPRVFLGGVPWDITEAVLLQTFQVFGALTVDWPGKDNKHNRHPPKGVTLCVCECEWGGGGGGGG